MIEQIEKDRKLFDIIRDIGYERFEDVYVVGGYVRDLLLERPNKDLDFTVIGNALEFAEEVAKILDVEVVHYFERFGTANFTYNGLELEFVTARKESYTEDSRKPEVEPGSLNDDLQRRDFTINAMAISINRTTYGTLIDKFSGQEHLDKGILKTPLSPEETFDDDPLRIMRLCRFTSQLGFHPDKITLVGATKMSPRLEIISQERITTEFLKILESNAPILGLRLLQETGSLKQFLPELEALVGQEQREDYHHKDAWNHTLEVVTKLSKIEKDPWMRLAALFHDIGKPMTKEFKEGIGWTFHRHEREGEKMIPDLFDRLRFPRSKLPLVQTLVGMHGRFRGMEKDEVGDSAIRRIIYEAGPYFDELIMLYLCDYSSHRSSQRIEVINEKIVERVAKIQEKEDLSILKSPIDGDRIMQLTKLSPGPKIGVIKTSIIDAILDETLENSVEAAEEYIKLERYK